jgi:CRISPR-associated protein Cas10/Csm1 subtype III-A
MEKAKERVCEHLYLAALLHDIGKCLPIVCTSIEENKNGFSFDSTIKRLKLKNNVYPVLLLGGDLSGIQKFIYNIAFRKTSVSLKERSFYLQQFIDFVIQRIITHTDINVNIGNVVYSSGGKFYMLLPNTGKVKKVIAELKSEFEQEL